MMHHLQKALVLLGTLCALSEGLTPTEIQILQNGGVSVTQLTTDLILYATGVPTHPYGPFPNCDNPNTLTQQNITRTIPNTPKIAAKATCLPMGPIGVAVNGVPLFNPWTAEGRNAVEGEYKETFDACGGHPTPRGMYHYHASPKCVVNDSLTDQLIGVAFDGFPIYGYKASDKPDGPLMSKDLDACHGRQVSSGYRYHVTADFPYILGCYKGEITLPSRPGGPGGPRPGGMGPPPPGAGPPPDGMGPPPQGNRPEGCPAVERPPELTREQRRLVWCTFANNSAGVFANYDRPTSSATTAHGLWIMHIISVLLVVAGLH